MTEKKTRSRRKVDKAKPTPQPTLFAHFGKRPTDAESEDSSKEPQSLGVKTAYNARVVRRQVAEPPPSQVTGKRRRAGSDSPPGTPARLRSRSPLVLPPSSPPRPSPSPPASPPARSSGPVVVLSSSPEAAIVVRSTPAVELDSSPLSSPAPLSSPPTPTRRGDESDGLELATHPFFAKKDKPVQRRALQASKAKPQRLVGSQDAPIEIGDEEPKSKNVAVHAFFQPRKGAGGVDRKDKDKDKGQGHLKGGQDAPWPCSESVHAGRGVESFEVRTCPVPRRVERRASRTVVSDEATRGWARMYRASQEEDDMLDLSTGHFDGWAGLRVPEGGDEEVPEEYAKHPAIARLLDPESGPRHAFAAPTNGGEVLGNEGEVKRLQDWLRALSLKRAKLKEVEEPSGKRKRKGKIVERSEIIRRVEKPRRRREKQNEYDPGIVVPDDWVEPDVEEVVKRYGNTAIVMGTTGSGKSAAIYACAQEFGWSVLEVHAGSGRRGIGANGLAALIGNAGANHMVEAAEKREVQESLILLDAVDTVFEQDTQFWSAVLNLVGESRRAVILTTHDWYAVPNGLLPIQEEIEFDAPDAELASWYLYAQARAALPRGTRLPSQAAFRALYEATAVSPRVPDFAVPDVAMHPHGSQMDRGRDLRRALEEVKFWVMHGRGCVADSRAARDVRGAWEAFGRDVVESVGDWSVGRVVRPRARAEGVGAERLWRFADALSCVDAWLERRWERQMQAGEVDRHAPGPDDQVLHNAREVCKPVAVDAPGIAEHCADADIALAALCLARRRLERGGAGGGARAGLGVTCDWNARWLEERRSEHQELTLFFLEWRVLALGRHWMPQPAVVLDIEPVVRRIVAADDAFAAGEQARTRASARIAGRGYVRYLGLHEKQEEALEAMRKTAYQLM